MDKNTIIGMVLIAGLVIGYTIFTSPTEEELAALEQERIEAEQDSINALKTVIVEDTSAVVTDSSQTTDSTATSITEVTEVMEVDTLLTISDTDTIYMYVHNGDTSIVHPLMAAEHEETKRIKDQYGLLSDAYLTSKNNPCEEYIIENDKVKMWISSCGGGIMQVELKEYNTYEAYAAEKEDNLLLFDSMTSSFGMEFILDRTLPIRTELLWFEPQFEGDSVYVSKGTQEFVFRLKTDSEDKYIDYVYSVGDDYMIDYRIDVVGMKDHLSTSSLSLTWAMDAPAKEKLIDNERMNGTVMFKYANEDRDYLSETSDDELNLIAKTEWVCFKQQYFSAFIFADEGFSKENSSIEVITLPEDTNYSKRYHAELTIPVDNPDNQSVGMQFYFGPNHYKTLAQYELGMERVINLGWGIFGWVNRFCVIPIFNWLDGFGIGYGLIILILTLIIKAVLFPLTYKNYKSSAKMRVLKPEIEKITAKYKDKKDRDTMMKKQQETMALYKKTGVNPMAGCVPMLLQMPILYAMFRFFPAAIELRQESFLWADDLSAYDSILDFGFNIPMYGDHISLFTVLMAASTFFYTKLNSSNMTTSGPGMPNMKIMLTLFPLMMLFFFNNFAAGLSYYYFIANLTSMMQMLVIKKYFIDENAILASIEQNKKKAPKKSKFQQRLEEAAKRRGR